MSRWLSTRILLALVTCILATSASAITLDLTTPESAGWIFEAYFVQFDPEGAQGTGNFDSFLRVQANTTERGYNTDGPLEFDTKAGKWTHVLDLQSIDRNVPIVDGSSVPGLTAGVQYREFLLDINETKVSNLLSLDELRIFVSDKPDNTGYPNLGTEIYNLGEGNSVILDYNLNSGSGHGDYAMYLPTTLFTDRYVYFYCAFGYQGGSCESSDGFEEWGVRTGGTSTVPEPSSIVAILCGTITGLGGLIRRKKV